jgi:tRNA (cytidine32/uridine32-2'-O)-methyltransferase
MLENIRIVLVNTSHPGNIGAVARAMKTMGLSNLYLVSPKLFPHVKADEMASGALDVLHRATLVPTIEEAIADCHLVIGTSARSRTIPWPLLNPKECAKKMVAEPALANVALVFGREQSGLTNDELHQCHFHVHIPSNPDYSSLNIAAAVQVLTYELRVAAIATAAPLGWDYARATHKEVAGFYEHLERVLIQLEFLNPKTPRQLMTRLRRLFNRAMLDEMEVNILRGILTAMERDSNGKTPFVHAYSRKKR